MPSHIDGQPVLIRYQEVEAELIVGQPNGEEAAVDRADALEGHLGQPIGHVQIVQDACHVRCGSMRTSQPSSSGRYSGQSAMMDRKSDWTVAYSGSFRTCSRSEADLNVFMVFSFDGHKKARCKGGRDGGEPGGSVRGGQGGCCVAVM